MYVYNHLNENIKQIFIYRLLHLFYIISCQIYCIILLAYQINTFFIISITVVNMLFILCDLWHIWDLIDANKLDISCFYMGCNIFGPIDMPCHMMLCVVTILYYINVKQYDVPEFILITIYAIPYYIGVLTLFICLLGWFIFHCYTKVSLTNDVVNQRYQLYNTFT